MTTVQYDPNEDSDVALIAYTLRDQFGHKAHGQIRVIVNTNSTKARVMLHDWSEIWINQYSDIEDLRDDVTYKPGFQLATTKKFEIIESRDGEYGFYDRDIVYNGQALPITYFYGKFDVTFAMKDSGNNYAEDGPRPVNVNYRPDLSFGPLVDSPQVILPEGAVVMATQETEYDTYNFMFGEDHGFMDMLYGYDFEDYDGNPLGTIGDNLPDNMRLLFRLDDGQLYPIEDFWQHAIVVRTISDPLTETQTTPTEYMVEFILEDSRQHQSLPTPAIRVVVTNNDPWINVPEFDLDGENLDYITVGEDYYIWLSSTGKDTDVVDDVTYGDVEADWIPSINQPLAHVGVVVEKYNEALSIFEELDHEFTTDEAGRYRFNYKVIDYHGAVAEASRDLEINTIPTIWNEVTNPGNLLEDPEIQFIVLNLDETYELWSDILFEDLDTDPLLLTHTVMREGETTPFMEQTVPHTVDLSTIIFDTNQPFVPGTFFVSYEVEDNWGEMDKIENSKEILVNTPPELTVEDEFMIVTEDDVIEPMAGVTVEDPEDQEAVDNEELEGPLEDRVVLSVYDEINDVEIDLETTAVNDLEAGVYRFNYTYTDIYEAEDSSSRLVVILSEPMIELAPQTVTMEPTGWFPVFNGVEFDDDELYSLLDDADIDYELDIYLAAYVEVSEGVFKELDDLEWVGNESIEIIYRLAIDFYEDVETRRLDTPSEDPQLPETNIVNEFTRDVVVKSTGMKDFILVTDFWRETWVETYGGYEAPDDSDLDKAGIGDYDDFECFAILSKFNPVTGEERLITAVWMDTEFDLESQSIDFDKECDFDDIAVTLDGEVIANKSSKVFKLNQETMIFEQIFYMNDEVENFFEREGYSGSYFWSSYQSLTVDERGYLVAAITMEDSDFYNYDVDFDDYEAVLLFFDLAGREVEEDDEGNGSEPQKTSESEEPDMYYLVEMALVDYGMFDEEQEYLPFDAITDIAYSADFSAIYGIGSYYNDPSGEYDEDESEEGSIDLESGQSRDSNKYYQIFRLEEQTLEVEQSEDESNLTATAEDIAPAIRIFEMKDVDDLEFGYMYRGMAVLGSNIYVSRFMTDCLAEVLYEETVEDVEVTLLRTQVGNLTYSDGFTPGQFKPVGGMFRAALGAAGHQTQMSLVPGTVEIRLYNDESATTKTATFTLTLTPELSYGDVEWSILGDDDMYLTNNNDGTFTLKPSVTSDMTLQIQAKAMNKVTGLYEMRNGNISIDYRIRPSGGDDGGDTTPAAAPTPATNVSVTLDTNAIVLDYGETADPEFTSYDFTETVTGTTNRAVTWELDDDTFVTVDANGVVTTIADIPADTGDITVTLTVRSVADPTATDTATILFEEQTPLGAIEFFDPYITGYTDGTFRPQNFVTRAEVASMFASILKLNVTQSGTQKFYDVDEDYWAYGQVQAMYRSGLFAGYIDANGNRYFDPEAPISRAEIAQVFTNYWKFLDISVDGTNVTPIPDVANTFWAAPAINRIFNTGIFTGFSDGTFRPNDVTLREQIVSMINKLIERPANQAESSKFTDILPTHEHFGDIEAASQTFLKPQGE